MIELNCLLGITNEKHVIDSIKNLQCLQRTIFYRNVLKKCPSV